MKRFTRVSTAKEVYLDLFADDLDEQLVDDYFNRTEQEIYDAEENGELSLGERDALLAGCR